MRDTFERLLNCARIHPPRTTVMDHRGNALGVLGTRTALDTFTQKANELIEAFNASGQGTIYIQDQPGTLPATITVDLGETSLDLLGDIAIDGVGAELERLRVALETTNEIAADISRRLPEDGAADPLVVLFEQQLPLMLEKQDQLIAVLAEDSARGALERFGRYTPNDLQERIMVEIAGGRTAPLRAVIPLRLASGGWCRQPARGSAHQGRWPRPRQGPPWPPTYQAQPSPARREQ